MSDLRSVNTATEHPTVGGSTQTASSLDTTAALAQGEAPNVNVAKAVSGNANKEHQAAEEAAKKARELGERFTGRPGGDVNDEAVKKSLQGSTEVKLDQVYPAGSGAAKDASGKMSEAAGQAAGSAKGALNAASGKASEAYNSAAQTASDVANAASNKGSEAYGAASTKASEASSASSEAGAGLVGSLQNTANAAVNMTGGYLASARDTATAATNRVLETVGMGGGQESMKEGDVSAKSAPLESGKKTVDSTLYPDSKTGGNVGPEVAGAPSARN